MTMFVSLTTEKFRKLFLTFFLMSCVMPMLIVLLVIYQHTVPTLTHDQLESLRGVFNMGILSILVIQALGFFLFRWWVNSFEQFTREVETFSSRHIGAHVNDTGQNGNELVKLNALFSQLSTELETRMREAVDNTRKMKQLSVRMAKLANTDELTGLYNRRCFEHKMNESSRRAEKIGHSMWLVRFEINRFSNYGDKDGDAILSQVGQVARDTLPRSAMAFRVGRNEFALLMSDCDGRQAARITHQLTTTIAEHPFLDHNGLEMAPVSISCGIAGFKKDHASLMADAGKALAVALRSGRAIGVAPAA